MIPFCGRRRLSIKNVAITALVLGLVLLTYWTKTVPDHQTKYAFIPSGVEQPTSGHDITTNDLLQIPKQPNTRQATKETRNINANGEELVKSLVKPQLNTMCVVELDDSQPRHFSSSTLNFSYEVTVATYSSYERYFTMLAKTSPQKPMKPWKGYISVRRFGQELSMCTKHLLKLVYLAASGPRKILLPRMKDGLMGSKGVPFSEFFDVDHLNQLLPRLGYSQLATEEEHDKMCKNRPKTIVYILYNTFKPSFLRHITNDVFLNLLKKVEREGWTECPGEPDKLKSNTFFCIHPTIIKNMALLEKNVLKEATCVEFATWNDPGKVNWQLGVMKTVGKDFISPSTIFIWLLKPSEVILEEATAFQKLRLERPYVAIHIRGAKFHHGEDIPRCFQIALEFVKALKLTRNVKTFFLSTDMSKEYGAINAKPSHFTLNNIINRESEAVIYDPKITGRLKVIDRWIVSLTEVQLLAQSDHLITIGYGSYHGFIVNRFLVSHLKRDRSTWSWTKLCFETGMRPKATSLPHST